ncbi:MAG: hypothetical protein Tsb0014_45090 [Pleurocapsa sp.]
MTAKLIGEVKTKDGRNRLKKGVEGSFLLDKNIFNYILTRIFYEIKRMIQINI